MGEKPVLLTVAEVADLLRIKRAKVYMLIDSGVIVGFKIGADWRVRLDSVERLIGPLTLAQPIKEAA